MLLKNTIIDHFRKHALGRGTLSLEKLIQHLSSNSYGKQPQEKPLQKLSLQLIEQTEKQAGTLNDHNISAYREVLDMIHFLQHGLQEVEGSYWGLGYPIPQEVFYGTDKFYELVASEGQFVPREKQGLIPPMMQLLYAVILERFYKVPNSGKDLLFSVTQAGVQHYYELQVDFRFVDIRSKSSLASIDLTSLRDKEEPSLADLEPIFRVLDPSNFEFSGFTLLHFKEKTLDYSLDRLHNLINELPQYKKEPFFQELHEILESLAGTKAVSSSLLPLLELNGYPLLSPLLARESIFFRELQKRKASGELDPAMAAYIKQPYPIIYGIEKSLDTENATFRQLIQAEGLASYICSPLKHRDKLVGFLEIYSHTAGELNAVSMHYWHKAMSLLTQLATEVISVFKSGLDQIILQNYTALNPVVEWRFNSVAARQLASYMNDEEPVMEKVRFEKVYPIYGAIDVRNSTQLRASMERKDNQMHLTEIAFFLEQLYKEYPLANLKQLLCKVHRLQQKMEGNSYVRYLQETFLFLQEGLNQSLLLLKKEQAKLEPLLDNFVQQQQRCQENAIDNFEVSLQQLNALLKDEVQAFNQVVQGIFPSYFELFRSDGIEYDLYVGQSITPTKRFQASMLKEIRKQQFISMSRAGRHAAALAPSLPIPMRVTLLAFVHSNTIDISFREDERRFDVEGGYNIRYQMVKKRIDKVRIQGSNERLVRPDMLAIVFQGREVESEIIAILEEIVELGYLKPGFESCTLEEIQGVSEMRALRAKIVLDDES